MAFRSRVIGPPHARPFGAVLLVGALAVIVLRAWASVSTGWTGLTVPEAATGVVSDVRSGSLAWLDGVRIGDRFELDAASGTVDVHTAEMSIGLSTGLPSLPLQPALTAASILVVGLAARLVVPCVDRQSTSRSGTATRSLPI